MTANCGCTIHNLPMLYRLFSPFSTTFGGQVRYENSSPCFLLPVYEIWCSFKIVRNCGFRSPKTTTCGGGLWPENQHCVYKLNSMPWNCFWHPLGVIQLFEPSFVYCCHLTFVITEDSAVGSSQNCNMWLCALLEDLRNLRIENPMYRSLELDY